MCFFVCLFFFLSMLPLPLEEVVSVGLSSFFTPWFPLMMLVLIHCGLLFLRLLDYGQNS